MAFSELHINAIQSFRGFFNGEPTKNLRVDDKNFCLPVLGLHHMDRSDMLEIDDMLDARRKSRARNTDGAFIFRGELLLMITRNAHRSPESLEDKAHWDFVNVQDNEGKVLAEWPGEKTAPECRAICQSSQKTCLGWVFVEEQEQCWLSSRIVPGQASAGSTSGLNIRELERLQQSPACEKHWRNKISSFHYT